MSVDAPSLKPYDSVYLLLDASSIPADQISLFVLPSYALYSRVAPPIVSL